MPLYEPEAELGSWTVARFIDSGGNGEVYEVRDGYGRQGALKVLLDYRIGSVAYQRFAREIRTVQSLGIQPGIIEIWEAHLPDEPRKRDRAWYVMPLAVPLERALQGQPVQHVVEAVAQIAEALASLHGSDTAHRDLKPGNLLWLEGNPVIGDFGLVHVPDETSLTETGRVPGSFGYIADEIMVEQESSDFRPADVFALAKVLWKLLVDGATYPPQGSLRADGGPHSLARNLTVPHADALDRILERATAPVSERLSMSAFAAELREWLALPEPTGLPEGFDVVLEAARRSMDGTVAERQSADTRARTVAALHALLQRESKAVIESVRSLDPGGAQVGALAIGAILQASDEQPIEGGTNPGLPFHHGVRIRRASGSRDQDVLVVDFCLQIPESGPGTVTGLLLSGDEETNDNLFQRLTVRRANPDVEMETAIAAAISEAATYLPDVLRHVADRG